MATFHVRHPNGRGAVTIFSVPEDIPLEQVIERSIKLAKNIWPQYSFCLIDG
jgi:hypothetical protein